MAWPLITPRRTLHHTPATIAVRRIRTVNAAVFRHCNAPYKFILSQWHSAHSAAFNTLFLSSSTAFSAASSLLCRRCGRTPLPPPALFAAFAAAGFQPLTPVIALSCSPRAHAYATTAKIASRLLLRAPAQFLLIKRHRRSPGTPGTDAPASLSPPHLCAVSSASRHTSRAFAHSSAAPRFAPLHRHPGFHLISLGGRGMECVCIG